MIFIFNFKTYQESRGLNSMVLAEIAYNASKNSQHKIIICPQLTDIQKIIDKFPSTENFEVWAQHIDYMNGDKNTGFITLNTLKSIGVKGSLLNHAEHKVLELDISSYLDICKSFQICFCIPDTFFLSLIRQKFPTFAPTYIAYEPPSLIGGNISVSQTHPDEILNIVEQFTTYNILVGAGIKNSKDVHIASKFGAKGIILSSGFVLSLDKIKFIQDLIK